MRDGAVAHYVLSMQPCKQISTADMAQGLSVEIYVSVRLQYEQNTQLKLRMTSTEKTSAHKIVH